MADTKISPHVILQNVYDPVSGKLKMDGTITIEGGGNLVTEIYDYYEIAYVVAGNGIGEPGTITYKLGGAAGTVVATILYAYDGSNRLTSVTKS